MRSPVDPGGLRRVALGPVQELGIPVTAPPAHGLGDAVTGPIPPPRFSSDVIARVSRTSSSVRCEFPRHLADLVFSLGAFERYSAQFENVNPRDAAFHHYLWQTAGHCRAVFEEALARLCSSN